MLAGQTPNSIKNNHQSYVGILSFRFETGLCMARVLVSNYQSIVNVSFSKISFMNFAEQNI